MKNHFSLLFSFYPSGFAPTKWTLNQNLLWNKCTKHLQNNDLFYSKKKNWFISLLFSRNSMHIMWYNPGGMVQAFALGRSWAFQHFLWNYKGFLNAFVVHPKNAFVVHPKNCKLPIWKNYFLPKYVCKRWFCLG